MQRVRGAVVIPAVKGFIKHTDEGLADGVFSLPRPASVKLCQCIDRCSYRVFKGTKNLNLAAVRRFRRDAEFPIITWYANADQHRNQRQVSLAITVFVSGRVAPPVFMVAALARIIVEQRAQAFVLTPKLQIAGLELALVQEVELRVALRKRLPVA